MGLNIDKPSTKDNSELSETKIASSITENLKPINDFAKLSFWQTARSFVPFTKEFYIRKNAAIGLSNCNQLLNKLQKEVQQNSVRIIKDEVENLKNHINEIEREHNNETNHYKDMMTKQQQHIDILESALKEKSEENAVLRASLEKSKVVVSNAQYYCDNFVTFVEKLEAENKHLRSQLENKNLSVRTKFFHKQAEVPTLSKYLQASIIKRLGSS